MSVQREKWEIAFSGRYGQCSKGDACSLNHRSHSGQRAQSSSSTSKAPTQTDERKPYRYGSPRGASLSGLKDRKPCQNILEGGCTEPSCDFWHPSVCMNYKSESGCKYGGRCHFRHTVASGQTSEGSQKSGGKGSVALLKETILLGCVSHDSPQRKPVTIGIDLHSQVVEDHDASRKN